MLLWAHGGYVRKGKQLVHRFELPKGMPRWREVVAAPAEGDAFFALVDEAIFEIRAGDKPVRRLRVAATAEGLARGPDGAILVRMIRRTKQTPLLYAWWPARREYAEVGPALFGFGKGNSTWFCDHGYAAPSGLVWAFETIEDDLRAIAWDAIAALPRRAES